nr:cell envelope integrity EipB family protein [Gellertiella hungarica]
MASPVAAAAGQPEDLVPHRAVYDLTLREANERAGIAGIYGRMVYEFRGSACAGYTTNFRFVTQIDTGEEKRLSDQQTTTYEDLNSRTFRFNTKSFTDQQLDKEVSGDAVERAGRIKVSLERPDKREVDLDGGRFPTEHMMDVLKSAREGKFLFESRIFDGSDTADQTLLATTVIGKPGKAAGDDPELAHASPLAGSEFWPVTIAYFNEGKAADAPPIYRMAFKLYGNGVIRDLTMDYSDYVLNGKLTKLDILPPDACK